MTTIDDIKPEPCDKTEIHYPHGWVDGMGAHACSGIANEEEQQKLIERLKELKAKADEIQAAQSQETDTPQYDQELVQRLSEEFDYLCQARHAMGAQKYGPVKFLEVDSLDEAAAEIIDLANYARYTFIKLRMLQAQIGQFQGVIEALQAAKKDLVVQNEPPVFTNPFRKD